MVKHAHTKRETNKKKVKGKTEDTKEFISKNKNEREKKTRVRMQSSHLLQRRRIKPSLRQLLLQVHAFPQAAGGGEEGVDEPQSPHLEAERGRDTCYYKAIQVWKGS